MNDALTLSAAALLGLAASGHCLMMCGGISAALGVATAKDAHGRPQPLLLVGYQLGRIASYSLAGLLFAGALGGLIASLDIEAVRRMLRALSAMALLLGALVAFGAVRDPGHGIGHRLWLRIAPLGRRLLPVASMPRAFTFGMVWGWMPCGFVYTVLLIASLQMDAARGATTMAAFGFGTAPALLASAFSAHRFAAFAARAASRRMAGAVLVASAAATLVGVAGGPAHTTADTLWMAGGESVIALRARHHGAAVAPDSRIGPSTQARSKPDPAHHADAHHVP